LVVLQRRQVVHLELRISPQMCEKIQNVPYGMLTAQVRRGNWFMKKHEVENLVALSI
jgi:hypothetical protein